MQVITTVTQKGQVTIPKEIRDKVGIKPRDKVVVKVERSKVQIDRQQTILDIAPLAEAPKGKNALKAREALEKSYRRV